MTKKREILNFISNIRNSHPLIKDIFLYGSCLNFFLILKSVYPNAIPYYNIDHVITKIDDTYYDITGVVNSKGYDLLTAYYDKKGTYRAFKQMLKGEFRPKLNET